MREKFDRVFLDMEYHHENGPPYGTVWPREELPEVVPEHIPLVPRISGSWCHNCEAAVAFDESRARSERWYHLELTKCTMVSPYSRYNVALDHWMQEMEEKYLKKEDRARV